MYIFCRLSGIIQVPNNIVGLPWWLSGKESACSAGDPGLVPGLRRSSGEGNGNPLQYSCLGNPRTEESGGLPSMGVSRVDTINNNKYM